MFTFLCIVWYLIGVGGFVFWWTQDWDFTVNELFLMIVVGGLGPLTWFIGFLIHGEGVVILKQRKK